MRAAVINQPLTLAIQRMDEPDPQPGQVLLQLEGCGVCGSDIPIWEGRPWFDYPLSPGRPGHEGWGRIVAIGDGVKGFNTGDRVASLSCAVYADHALCSAEDIVAIPHTLQGKPFPAEPLACAMNSFQRAGVNTGYFVAVVGGGFQGLLMTQLAARAGAEVTMLSRRKSALERGIQMGAARVLLLDDAESAIAQACSGLPADGFDVVMECGGHQATLDVASRLVRTRGRLVVVGYHQEPRQVNMQQWNWRGIDVINAHERDHSKYVNGIRDAIAAVQSGQLEPWSLFTHTFPLDDLEHALNTVRKGDEGVCKVLVAAQ